MTSLTPRNPRRARLFRNVDQNVSASEGPMCSPTAREIIKMRERLSQVIATETGQSIERVRRDTDRNYWMSASEAIDYGLASKIVHSIEDLK
jgi:ATP-dependent protease ClpP protease subunit